MKPNLSFPLVAAFALTCGAACNKQSAPSSNMQDAARNGNQRNIFYPETLDRKTITTKFREGMSEKEVIETFGQPMIRSEGPGFEVLRYYFDPASPLKEGNEYMAGFNIYISGGKAIKWDFTLSSGPV